MRGRVQNFAIEKALREQLSGKEERAYNLY
jgi:hypothetical protein